MQVIISIGTLSKKLAWQVVHSRGRVEEVVQYTTMMRPVEQAPPGTPCPAISLYSIAIFPYSSVSDPTGVALTCTQGSLCTSEMPPCLIHAREGRRTRSQTPPPSLYLHPNRFNIPSGMVRREPCREPCCDAVPNSIAQTRRLPAQSVGLHCAITDATTLSDDIHVRANSTTYV